MTLPSLVQIISWSIPAGFMLLLFALYSFVKNPAFRKDLRGAMFLVGLHLALRGIDLFLPQGESSAVHKFFAVAIRLSLAFSVLRAMVGTGLHLLRLRGLNPPNILRNVLDFTLYTLVTLPVLKSQLAFDLTGVVATSAVLSVVIGLALQDTLGNLFAGLSLQLDMPFAMGDWVTIGPHTGHVVNFSWRATRLQKRTLELVTVPNNLVAKESVRNHSRGGTKVAVDERVSIAVEGPPNRVRALLLETIRDCPSVVRNPEPFVRVEGYEDVAVRYWIRYWVATFLDSELVRDEFYARLWYRLRREGLEHPYPRNHVVMRPPVATPWPLEERMEMLRGVELLQGLDESTLTELAQGMRVREWGAGERVVQQGEPGETFYVVAKGTLTVMHSTQSGILSRLKPGDCFGEASLLTGDPRSANVDAVEDVVLLEVDRPLFRKTLLAQPALAEQLSQLLADRKGSVRSVASAGGAKSGKSPTGEAADIFSRLRHIFSL